MYVPGAEAGVGVALRKNSTCRQSNIRTVSMMTRERKRSRSENAWKERSEKRRAREERKERKGRERKERRQYAKEKERLYGERRKRQR